MIEKFGTRWRWIDFAFVLLVAFIVLSWYRQGWLAAGGVLSGFFNGWFHGAFAVAYRMEEDGYRKPDEVSE